jgi:superfamily II DNA or RNA helicase
MKIGNDPVSLEEQPHGLREIFGAAKEIVERLKNNGEITKGEILAQWKWFDDEKLYVELNDIILESRNVEKGPHVTGGFIAKIRKGSPIVKEIIERFNDKGEITQDEILTHWPMFKNENLYSELQKIILDDRIEKGPRGVGGFIAKKRMGTLPDDSLSAGLLLKDEWERMTVGRFCELFDHKTLESFLGPSFLYVIRETRRRRTDEDRRGTKRELAVALIVKHGVDLMADANIRQDIASKCRLDFPQKWYPGKNTAIEFIKSAGLPPQLAGVETPRSRPDYEYLEGHFILAPLADFQKEVKEKIVEKIKRPSSKAIVTLPTGAGKTRVAVEAARDCLTELNEASSNPSKKAILWLAHTEELCEQACLCFKQVWESSSDICGLHLVRFWGKYTTDFNRHHQTLKAKLTEPCVLVSTPQRIVNIIESNGSGQNGDSLFRIIDESLRLMVIDEAHRAAAPSYRRILKTFNRQVALIGLTATPFRDVFLGGESPEGTEELREIFRYLVEPIQTLGENPRIELQKRKILATPEFIEIETPAKIRIPRSFNQQGDFITDEEIGRIDEIMGREADALPRRLAILEKILPIARLENNSILYFGPSVKDAEQMAFLLRQENIASAVVSGDTRDSTRRQMVAEFKDGKIRVLCNCEVLTTGFDAPMVTHVVMARPTVSLVLYEQMIGRGLRGVKFGGTDSCKIINCKDNFPLGRPELGYEAARNIWAAKPRTPRKKPTEDA